MEIGIQFFWRIFDGCCCPAWYVYTSCRISEALISKDFEEIGMSLEQRINYQLNKYPGVKNVPGKAKALYSFLKMGLKSFFISLDVFIEQEGG